MIKASSAVACYLPDLSVPYREPVASLSSNRRDLGSFRWAVSLREMCLPALGVAEVDGGSELAVLIQKSQPVLSAAGNFPVSMG